MTPEQMAALVEEIVSELAVYDPKDRLAIAATVLIHCVSDMRLPQLVEALRQMPQ